LGNTTEIIPLQHTCGTQVTNTTFGFDNLKGRDHFGDVGTDGDIITKWCEEEEGGGGEEEEGEKEEERSNGARSSNYCFREKAVLQTLSVCP
jgi:hypothetical protein